MKKCPKCGLENSDSMRFCVECGTPLADAPIVINLQNDTAQNQSDVKTEFFGKSTETQIGSRGFPQNFSAPPKKRRTGLIFLILGGILVLFLLFSAIVAAVAISNWDEIAKLFDEPTPKPTVTPTRTPTPAPSVFPSQTATVKPTSTPKNSPSPASNYPDVSTAFDRIWVDYNITEKNRKGMRIHTKFTVKNLKNVESYLAVFFENEDGTKILSNNREFRSKDGQLAVYRNLKPAYDNTVYNDLTTFLPYSEFQLKSGKYNLKMDVDLIDKNGDLIQHLTYYDFWYEEP